LPKPSAPPGRIPLPSVRAIGFSYAIAGASAGAISLFFGQSQNYHVFVDAARALMRGEDLYVLRSADYFKYSPTFAFLFLPFACVPAWLGAPLWSLVNFAVAFAGICRALDGDRERRLALLVAFAGILLSTDGDQSNLLVGGATLLALDAFERSSARASSRYSRLPRQRSLFSRPADGAASPIRSL
jgi:Glycosyltransferase family 87